jgi:hypothetical protein
MHSTLMWVAAISACAVLASVGFEAEREGCARGVAVDCY